MRLEPNRTKFVVERRNAPFDRKSTQFDSSSGSIVDVDFCSSTIFDRSKFSKHLFGTLKEKTIFFSVKICFVERKEFFTGTIDFLAANRKIPEEKIIDAFEQNKINSHWRQNGKVTRSIELLFSFCSEKVGLNTVAPFLFCLEMSTSRTSFRDHFLWIRRSLDVFKATLIRIVFALHATVAIIRIVITRGDYWYLLNMCGVNFLFIELVVTIVKRRGFAFSI